MIFISGNVPPNGMAEPHPLQILFNSRFLTAEKNSISGSRAEKSAGSLSVISFPQNLSLKGRNSVSEVYWYNGSCFIQLFNDLRGIRV
jgi:hypothetical protein